MIAARNTRQLEAVSGIDLFEKLNLIFWFSTKSFSEKLKAGQAISVCINNYSSIFFCSVGCVMYRYKK